MIVAGFGFRADATEESLHDALRAAAGNLRPDVLAAPDDKAEQECLVSLAKALSLPIRPLSREQISGVTTLTQSPLILEKRQTGSVAEAVALAAAGQNGALIGPRCISKDRLATAAIAISGAV